MVKSAIKSMELQKQTTTIICRKMAPSENIEENVKKIVSIKYI